MIKVDCFFCGRELFEPGGLLFSPPHQGSAIDGMVVTKDHICTRCYTTLMAPAIKIQISFGIHEDD